MFHEPSKNFLYSAYKITTEHSDGHKTKTGTATGFILDIGNKRPYIITNRHVIDIDYNKPTPKYKDFKLTKLEITGRNSDDIEYTIRLNSGTLFYLHDEYENDIVLIEARVNINEDKSFHWHFGLEHLADKEIFKKIQPFDLICYAGFPDTHDKFQNRPIIRSGHIASDPLYNYSWDNQYKGQCVAYEGFSSAGSSGSPIYAPARGMNHIPNSRHGYLIGVNAGHIPTSLGHSGISYFYKSTLIRDIIDKHKLLEVI